MGHEGGKQNRGHERPPAGSRTALVGEQDGLDEDGAVEVRSGRILNSLSRLTPPG